MEENLEVGGGSVVRHRLRPHRAPHVAVRASVFVV